jgi:hypothetical protein
LPASRWLLLPFSSAFLFITRVCVDFSSELVGLSEDIFEFNGCFYEILNLFKNNELFEFKFYSTVIFSECSLISPPIPPSPPSSFYSVFQLHTMLFSFSLASFLRASLSTPKKALALLDINQSIKINEFASLLVHEIVHHILI